MTKDKKKTNASLFFCVESFCIFIIVVLGVFYDIYPNSYSVS
jgi:hypothetical protein